jgi:hypothetical protein
VTGEQAGYEDDRPAGALGTDHDWHLFDAEEGWEVRRVGDTYEVRRTNDPRDIRVLGEAGFELWRWAWAEDAGPRQTANPDPAHITDAMWTLWLECREAIRGVRLGGIYANKRCYHNTVNANQRTWPGAYCIRLPLDLRGPPNKARAIDLTMTSTEMRKRTRYLRRAALHPEDNRLAAMREFYGTLDGKTVYGLIRDANGAWVSSTSDTSHLWHVHASIYTAYCAVWSVLAPIVSVLDGVTWNEWTEPRGDMPNLYVTQSTDPAWNNHHYLSNGVQRRRLRNPGGIHQPAAAGATRIVLTDAMRTSVSANETWDRYITSVAGPSVDWGFTRADRDTLAEILAAAQDDGNLAVQLDAASMQALQDLTAKLDALPGAEDTRGMLDEALDERPTVGADHDR